MRFVNWFLVLVLTLVFNLCFAQADRVQTVSFQPVFNEKPIHLDGTTYHLANGDSVSIGEIRLYISSIELLDGDTKVWSEQNSFHLIDAAESQSMTLGLQIPAKLQFDEISFNLGIDSTTNVSGAMGGDLDPTKGMYWAWQSGYINFKLEGTSTYSTARNQQFQFHLGGYQYPYNSLQKVSLSVVKDEPINIHIDIAKLLTGIDLAQQNHIMSPSKAAVLLSEKVSSLFIIQGQ